MSAQQAAQLRAALERAFSPSALEIIDDSARHAGHAGARSGGHFRVLVVADAFRGQAQLARHRLVYEAVGALLQGTVHALNIQARTPEEHRAAAGGPPPVPALRS
jgi:BolA family transcriptional regulator, general stress-responsive regulator